MHCERLEANFVLLVFEIQADQHAIDDLLQQILTFFMDMLDNESRVME